MGVDQVGGQPQARPGHEPGHGPLTLGGALGEGREGLQGALQPAQGDTLLYQVPEHLAEQGRRHPAGDLPDHRRGPGLEAVEEGLGGLGG